MTTFDALESSVESSRPLEVYRFAVGGEEFLYTSNPLDVVVDSETYETIAIQRDNIVVGQTERNRALKIRIPSDNVLAENFMGVPPGQRGNVTITRLQRDEVPTFNTKIIIYTGSLKAVQFPQNQIAEFSAQTAESIVGRHLPQYTFMGMCNHTLYGPGCNVDPVLFSITGKTITAVSGRDITVTGASASGFDFTGGYCKLTGTLDFRLILKQAGDVLTLMIPFKDDVNGSMVDVFAGCDHLIGGDCALTFDNVIQNGSFSFVPSINIFEKGLTLESS